MKYTLYVIVICQVCIFMACDKREDRITPKGFENNKEHKITLHDILINNNSHLINELVANGLDVNERDASGETPLGTALRIEGIDPNTVNYLLALGANPNIPDNKGVTPLEIAISLGKNQEAISLLENGASLEISQDKKGTLIHTAIYHCNADVIKKMLECGGEKLLYTKGEIFPVYPVELAIDIQGDIDVDGEEVASMILEHMDLEHCDQYGNTMLHRECMRGDIKLIKLLLEKDINVNAKNDQGLTPLDIVNNYNQNREDIKEVLREKGANERVESIQQGVESHISESSFLDALRQKGNLNETDINQGTYLHQACDMGYESVVHYLLANGADVNVLEKHKFTPLHFAAMNGNINIIKLLVNSGATLDIADKFGQIPLDWAVMLKENSNKGEIINLLIEKGSPINGTENSDPPIFCAIGTKSNDALEILIKNGADVNVFNRVGETPLVRAVLSDNLDAFELLLENGADVNKIDKKGLAAFDYIQRIEGLEKQRFMNVLEQKSQ